MIDLEDDVEGVYDKLPPAIVREQRVARARKLLGLNKPKQTPQGMLDTKYFLDLLQFVGITSKEQTKG